MSWRATRPFEPTELGPTELLAFIEDVASSWHASAIVSAVGTVGVASITRSGEHQDDESEPQINRHPK
jgi:hypothetical protein